MADFNVGHTRTHTKAIERRCPICDVSESDVISDGCPAEDLDPDEHDCLAVRLEEARRP